MDVEMAKDSLMIGYAAGNSRTSVTQDVTLPTAGANGVSISWESSNAARISTTGTVSRPSAANTEVTLIATLTKNDARDTRTFTLTVVPPCTTSEMIPKLKADPPSLSGCSAVSIQGADMPALRSTGVTSAQFLPVWSADQDMGFTPAQLWEASVTIAEMKSHGLTIPQMYNMGQGVPSYTLFNEVCMSLSSITCSVAGVSQECTENFPSIMLDRTPLNATDTAMVLRGGTQGSAAWSLSTLPAARAILDDGDSIGFEVMLGSATARLVSRDGGIYVSTLSIPLADVFSNPMVSVHGNQLRTTSIQLCPGM